MIRASDRDLRENRVSGELEVGGGTGSLCRVTNGDAEETENSIRCGPLDLFAICVFPKRSSPWEPWWGLLGVSDLFGVILLARKPPLFSTRFPRAFCFPLFFL